MATSKDGGVSAAEFTRDEWLMISQGLTTSMAVKIRAGKAESDPEIRALHERNAQRIEALRSKVNNLSLL